MGRRRLGLLDPVRGGPENALDAGCAEAGYNAAGFVRPQRQGHLWDRDAINELTAQAAGAWTVLYRTGVAIHHAWSTSRAISAQRPSMHGVSACGKALQTARLLFW